MKRFINKGRITNYEIEPLRLTPPPRRARWRYLWSTLADRQHPHSQEDWDQMMDDNE
jgi:hypothetical protein